MNERCSLIKTSLFTGSGSRTKCCIDWQPQLQHQRQRQASTMSLSFSHAVESILSSTTSFSQLLHSWWPKKRVKHRRKTRRRLKERRWHLKGAVKPLPRIRERSLTLPLPDDDGEERKGNTKSSKSQVTHDQSQSNFFSKLPPEIRLQIYSHVFADGKTSIIKDSRRRYVTWMPRSRSMLPLLLTCRRV